MHMPPSYQEVLDTVAIGYCVMLMGACAQLSHPNESAVSSTIFQFLTRGTFVTDGRCCNALSLSFCVHAHPFLSSRIACTTLHGPFP